MAKILILGKDVDICFFFQVILEKEKHTCVSVTTPKEAATHLRGSNIDLIFLSEIFLSDFIEFYNDLKIDSELCNVPVILYSSIPLRDKLQFVPEECGDVVMLRPIDPFELWNEVNRLMKKKM